MQEEIRKVLNLVFKGGLRSHCPGIYVPREELIDAALSSILIVIGKKMRVKLNIKMQSKFAEPINENYLLGYNIAIAETRKALGIEEG